MRWLSLTCLLFFASSAFALAVPVQSFNLNGKATVHISYAFNSHPIIYCYANTPQTTGVIAWPYKGKSNQAQLPISLKTSSQYDGSFADPTGEIVISNTLNTVIQIGCVYAF